MCVHKEAVLSIFVMYTFRTLPSRSTAHNKDFVAKSIYI